MAETLPIEVDDGRATVPVKLADASGAYMADASVSVKRDPEDDIGRYNSEAPTNVKYALKSPTGESSSESTQS